MRIDHHGFHIIVAQEFLDGSNAEGLYPVAIALLSSSAVLAGAQGFTEAIQEFRFWTGFRRNSWVLADWI